MARPVMVVLLLAAIVAPALALADPSLASLESEGVEQDGAPKIRPISDVTMRPLDRGLVGILAASQDPDQVTLELVTAPDFASLYGGMVRLAPSHDDVGTHDIVVRATTGRTASFVSFAVTVAHGGDGLKQDANPGYGALLFSDDFEAYFAWDRTEIGEWDRGSAGWSRERAHGDMSAFNAYPYDYHVLSSHTCVFMCWAQIVELFDTASPLVLTFEMYVDGEVDSEGMPPEGLYVEYQPGGRGEWVTAAEYPGGGDYAGLWVKESITLDIPEDTAYLRLAARSSGHGGIIQVNDVKVSSASGGVVFWDDFEYGTGSSLHRHDPWHYHGPGQWEFAMPSEGWLEWARSHGHEIGSRALVSSDCDYQCVATLDVPASDSPVILNFDRYLSPHIAWDERLQVQVRQDGWRTVAEYYGGGPNRWQSESIPLDGLSSLRFVVTSTSEFSRFYIDNIEVYEAPR